MKEQSVTISKICKSYCDSVNKNSPQSAEQSMDFRRIIQETKNEELLQQRELDARAKNIIIHGFQESTKKNEGNEEDRNIVNELLNIHEVNTT